MPGPDQRVVSFFKYSATVWFNCSSIVITGCQPSRSLALELSTCSEPNRRFATSPLPINLAAKPIKPTRTFSSLGFLPEASATLRNNCVVDTSSPSEIKNTWLAALGDWVGSALLDSQIYVSKKKVLDAKVSFKDKRSAVARDYEVAKKTIKRSMGCLSLNRYSIVGHRNTRNLRFTLGNRSLFQGNKTTSWIPQRAKWRLCCTLCFYSPLCYTIYAHCRQNDDFRNSFWKNKKPDHWSVRDAHIRQTTMGTLQSFDSRSFTFLKNVISNETIDLIKNKICQTISEFLDKALQLDKAYLDSEKKALAICELRLNLKPEM